MSVLAPEVLPGPSAKRIRGARELSNGVRARDGRKCPRYQYWRHVQQRYETERKRRSLLHVEFQL